jgi:hypothetical protein
MPNSAEPNMYPVSPTIQVGGWRFTNATLLVACPRCGSEAGFYCQYPSGRRAFVPHTERMVEYAKLR